jgi:multidrug efflux pump subunit AcrB
MWICLKLEAYELTFDDIEFAISQENVSISGGEIKLGDTRRSVRTVGEFKTSPNWRISWSNEMARWWCI